LGMVSGGQVKNPGMSVWVFAVLAKVFHATTPPELAQAVGILNILGLLALAFFSLRLLPEKERLAWCWATAFAAVSPAAILFQRKIWAQSTLPFFCVLLWIAWHYRKEKAGAFFWGLVGLCLAQVHMSGFFLIAGLFLWTVYRDKKAQWGFWIAGSLVGAVPLIPWLKYLFSNAGSGSGLLDWFWLFYPKYWIYWLTDALGLGLQHSLKWAGLFDFMRYPVIGGMNSCLVGLLHVLILVCAVRIFIAAKRASGGFLKGLGDSSETGLALNSVLIVSGVLMTLCCFKINQHYLIMSFPLEWVWLARLGLRDARSGQRYLMLIWVAQALISAWFLIYVHVHHGIPAGDYGTAYQYQIP